MMMRRKLYATMVAIAVCVLLGLSVVPHHHHHGMICMAVHSMAHDEEGHDSDAKRCGDAASHHDDDGSTCVERCTYLFSRMEQVVPVSWTHAPCAWMGDCPSVQLIGNRCKPRLWYYRFPLCRMDVHGATVLRAPPCLDV
ncbi:MAG: hypothetical protein Q4E55_05565 [Bacteroidales bacterium]|nr:hypothetical protein [Bacteroidales bacterium]